MDVHSTGFYTLKPAWMTRSGKRSIFLTVSTRARRIGVDELLRWFECGDNTFDGDTSGSVICDANLSLLFWMWQSLWLSGIPWNNEISINWTLRLDERSMIGETRTKHTVHNEHASYRLWPSAFGQRRVCCLWRRLKSAL